MRVALRFGIHQQEIDLTIQRFKPAVTVAAIVERDGRFLLVEEETAEGLRWNQPAGHLEPDESLLQAVVRETLEETAHELTALGLLGVYLTPAGEGAYLRFAFVGTVGHALPGRRLDMGIHRAFWADADEVRARPDMHRSPAVMRCIDDYLSARERGRAWLPLDSLAYLPELGDAR